LGSTVALGDVILRVVIFGPNASGDENALPFVLARAYKNAEAHHTLNQRFEHAQTRMTTETSGLLLGYFPLWEPVLDSDSVGLMGGTVAAYVPSATEWRR